MERGDRPVSAEEAASALEWWAEAGVDCLVGETPRNWLAPAPQAAPQDKSHAPAAPPAQLNLFHAFLADNAELPFAAPEAPRVCPSGDPASDLMLMTDMPSSEDCASGALLSGEAGRLLDRMLAAIGRDRSSVYLASLSCLRSPSGSFTEDSATHCAALARHHVGLVQPQVVLLLGDTCCKAMLGMAVMQARGRWHQISTHSGDIAAMASFHPSYLLERPATKRQAWADLQMLMERLGQ